MKNLITIKCDIFKLDKVLKQAVFELLKKEGPLNQTQINQKTGLVNIDMKQKGWTTRNIVYALKKDRKITCEKKGRSNMWKIKK